MNAIEAGPSPQRCLIAATSAPTTTPPKIPPGCNLEHCRPASTISTFARCLSARG